MGSYAVLVVLATLLIGGGVLLNAQRFTADASDTTAVYTSDYLGREAAKLGVQQVVRRLVDQPGAWTPDVALMDTRFRAVGTHIRGTQEFQHRTDFAARITAVTIAAPPAPGAPITAPDVVEITSTGTAIQNGDTTRYVVRAIYQRGYTDIGVPPSLRYAILADDAFDIQGSVNVVGGIHTNGGLTSGGGGFSVTGTATYTDSWDRDNAGNYSGGVYQQERIDLPPVAIPPTTFTLQRDGSGRGNEFEMQASANPGTSVANGWYGVTGQGTIDNPYVLYVNGNLVIKDGIRLPGHVRIYVNGNLDMSANGGLAQVPPSVPVLNANSPSFTHPVTRVTYSGDQAVMQWRDYYSPNGNTIGLFVKGSVELDGTPFVQAQIYAEGDVVYKGGGNKMILGGVVSRGQIVVQGNPKIYYNQASTTIYDPGLNLNQPDGLILVSSREWARRPGDS